MAETKTPTKMSQKPQKTYKRSVKNIVIHKPMQREFSFVLIALLMVSTLAIGFVIHHTIHSAVFSGFRFGKVSPYEILSDVSYQLIIRVSCILFISLIVIAMFGMLFLHRVAGPVYRFRQTFLALNRGEVPNQIHLREGDFFTETAKDFNRFIRRVDFEYKRRDKTKALVDKMAASAKVTELKKVLEEDFKDPEEKTTKKKR